MAPPEPISVMDLENRVRATLAGTNRFVAKMKRRLGGTGGRSSPGMRAASSRTGFAEPSSIELKNCFNLPIPIIAASPREMPWILTARARAFSLLPPQTRHSTKAKNVMW